MLQLEEINGDSNNAFERFQNNLDMFNAQGNRGYKILISTGTISCGPECQYSIAELLEKADKLMYEHKRNKQKL